MNHELTKDFLQTTLDYLQKCGLKFTEDTSKTHGSKYQVVPILQKNDQYRVYSKANELIQSDDEEILILFFDEIRMIIQGEL
jgi:hypothetical protein